MPLHFSLRKLFTIKVMNYSKNKTPQCLSLTSQDPLKLQFWIWSVNKMSSSASCCRITGFLLCFVFWMWLVTIYSFSWKTAIAGNWVSVNICSRNIKDYNSRVQCSLFHNREHCFELLIDNTPRLEMFIHRFWVFLFSFFPRSYLRSLITSRWITTQHCVWLLVVHACDLAESFTGQRVT